MSSAHLSAAALPSPSLPDLSTCDHEPIHIPGSIQPHGILFTLVEPSLAIAQSSVNAVELLGTPQADLAGESPLQFLPPEDWQTLRRGLTEGQFESSPLYVCTVRSAHNRRAFYAIAHRHRGILFLELEPTDLAKDITFQDLYPLVRSFMGQIKSAATVESLAQLAADEVRRITGFGRVLVYRFNPQWDGHVIGESHDAAYPSFLDLRFPASDIPQQARALYTLNRLRLIGNSNYRPVPILPALHPASDQPLDMSFSTLRSVSPVHIEYLQNMGVVSSMSISIVTGDSRLWGLIACHHHHERMVPFDVRTACDLLGQSLSVQVEATEQRSAYEQRIRLQGVTTRLLSFMAQEESFIDALVSHPDELLSFVNASGAAVVFDDSYHRIGDCPGQHDLSLIVDWLLASGRKEVFSTDSLPMEMPDGEHFRRLSSGLLAVSISQLHRSYILWFRPEVVQTVKWAGNPEKAVEHGTGRLHPRRSFESWKEIVRLHSAPWHPSEVEAAAEFRNAVIGIVLRKAEELAELSAELQRSNTELEAFSYSVSHDLRAPFRHILGYAELLRQSPTIQLEKNDQRYLDVIINSANFAGNLVDALLNFSQVGRSKLKLQPINMRHLVEEVRREFGSENLDRTIEWQIDNLSPVVGDLTMLRLVVQNLLQNAIKYTRDRATATIHLSSQREGNEVVFSVRDNGVGFDQNYADKLFGVFQRLHRIEDYEGTGVGLANVRRIITKHGGRTWAEGKVGEGAQFFFSLPFRGAENG